MLFSIALIIIVGLSLSSIFEKLKLPSLIGFLLTGILLGPFVLNLLSESLLNISSELRQIALIIILLRAGLMLNSNDLKKIGRPAVLMCFVPAILEIAAIAFLAPLFFDISFIDAFLLGAVLAAVSPAIIVPRMIKMIEQNEGTKKGIPQLIMASASVDDVFVIVLFSVFLSLSVETTFSALSFAFIPVAIFSGVLAGVILGLALTWFFCKYHMRDSVKVIIILAITFCLVTLEGVDLFPFSGLLATITIGIVLLSKYEKLAKRLSDKFSKLWVAAEIFLFVLVGASLNISYFLNNLGLGVLLIMLSLILRMLGVWLSLIKTHFNNKEKLFCSFAYTPKATVQAAIGSIPLLYGLASGNLILSLAVISIILTAPIGSILIDKTKTKLL